MTDFEQSFQGTLCRLLMYSPFSFNLLVGMDTVPTESIDTMGVQVKNGRIRLMYNPNFFMSLEEGERTFVLIHEMMHVLLHHCTHRCSSDICRAYKENVAMDLAINCLIVEETGIKIPRFKKDMFGHRKGEIQSLLPSMFGFKDGLSFEQYMDLLDKKYPDVSIRFVPKGSQGDSSEKIDSAQAGGNAQSGSNAKTASNAEDGGNTESGDNDFDALNQRSGAGARKVQIDVEIDGDCGIGKITKGRIDDKHGKEYDEDAYIDDFVRNVVENIERNHSWGCLGNHAVEMVKKAQEQPLNWGDILRLKLGPFLSYQKEQSRRRWNKHYGKPFLGYTTKCVEPVAVYADTSGSVGSADLSRFIVEIERIANYTGVYLWSFDCDVKDPNEYTLFTRRSIDEIQFKGRGGTRFSPVFEHAREKNFSQVVVLTDGYAENIDPKQTEGMEVIWIITKDGCTTGKPGTVIKINR